MPIYASRPIKRTRFAELRYEYRGDHWRILDWHGKRRGEDAAGIGPQYPTEVVLLADLDRFAHVYGANPDYVPPLAPADDVRRVKAAVDGMLTAVRTGAYGAEARAAVEPTPKNKAALAEYRTQERTLFAVLAQIRVVVTGSTAGDWPAGWE